MEVMRLGREDSWFVYIGVLNPLDLTNTELKLKLNKISQLPPTQTQKFPKSKTNLSHSGNYYIVLGIINNLEMVVNIQKYVHRLYAYTKLSHIRNLNILISGIQGGFLNQIPHGYQGMTAFHFHGLMWL